MNTQKQQPWSKLDNAAKIFPPNSGRADTKVFRFSCQLVEDVDPAVLLLALQETVEDLPSFRYVLRHGVFWYYLEHSDIPVTVKLEDSPPCSALYADARSPLFEVTYFHKRINLETYHAITDGAGALEFLRGLVCHYLSLCNSIELGGETFASGYDASQTQGMLDSFDKYYSGKSSGKKNVLKRAHILNDPKMGERRLKIIEGVMPADKLLETARSYNTSLTEFVTALLMFSVREELAQRDKTRPVVVSVPVNLRKYFSSQSLRNFFSVINVGYDFPPEAVTLKQLATEVHRAMAEGLTLEHLQNRLDNLADLEHKLYTRLVPLPIKDIALKAAYRRTEQEYTTTLSNLGRIDMPAELWPYIDRFSVINSTKDLQVCICSYQNKLCIAFTSRLVSTDIQRRFFRMLTDLSIPVEIVSNNFQER